MLSRAVWVTSRVDADTVVLTVENTGEERAPQTLTLAARPAGGLCVTMQLPLAPPHSGGVT